MTQAPTSVWNEVRFTSEGISISLFSESTGGDAILEDEMWFTYDELQEMSPSAPLSLSLSETTKEGLSEQHNDAIVGNLLREESQEEMAEIIDENPSTEQLLAYMGLLEDDDSQSTFSDDNTQSKIWADYEKPDVGDIMWDDYTKLPSWAEDSRVKITKVTTTPASEYVVEDADSWRANPTVANMNTGEPPNAPVVEGQYFGNSSKTYAFPITRLDR